MNFTGPIAKMQVSVDDSNTALYHLPIGNDLVNVNDLIGQTLQLSYDNKIHCVHCHRLTNKSFNQGYCYPCLQSLAQCDSCIVKPELCHYAAGTCREPQWGDAHCFNDHIVYLANTGKVKAGITRQLQKGVSSRWIDQGATQAIPLYRVANRLISGLVETACKQYVGDKTNWQTMLKNQYDRIDLVHEAESIKAQIKADIQNITDKYGLLCLTETPLRPVDINYPVTQYPDKVSSIGFDKVPTFTSRLLGIKGQYWYLEDSRVINIRKHAGYVVSLSVL